MHISGALIILQLSEGVISMAVLLLLSAMVSILFLTCQQRLCEQQSRRRARELILQKELLSTSIQMEEAEWRQSAASLHDGLGAMLSVVKMYMQQIDANGNKEDLIEIKEESIQFLEESIRIIREQFYCLFPVSLERFGLLAALEDFAEREKEKTGMDIKVVGDDYRRFTSQKEMGLFRIVQGLYKFSREKMQASSVIIRICQKNGYFHVYYKDNGIGVLTQKRPELQSLVGRAKSVDAVLSINASSGRGVDADIRLSLG